VNAGRKSKNRSKHDSKRAGSSNAEIRPLEYLLAAMNDNGAPMKRRLAIAKKIAPYFHAKLKPISPEELFTENFIEDGAETEDDADTDAEHRS
jgi:hypothetical protein